MSSLHLSAVIYNLSRDIRADLRLRVMDGRASAHTTRFPFEFARCTRRIKYQNSISSGIAILRDSPMVPSPLAHPPALSFSLFLGHPHSTHQPFALFPAFLQRSTRARCALYLRECARVHTRRPAGRRAGGRGYIYIYIYARVAFSWENNSLLRA